MRAFVAVEMSEPIRRAVADLVAELERTDAPVKWVRQENLHLTLKFLGEVTEDNVPKAIDILRRCADGVAQFRLEVKGVGGFPNLGRPRVVFVEARDTPPLARELARRLNREMTRAGVPREDRPFRNHVTIGRVRKPRLMPALAKRLEQCAERMFGTMTVAQVAFIKSDLRPDGPVYTPVEHVDLSGETT